MSTRGELTKLLISETAATTDSIIAKGLPENYDVSKCHYDVYPGGVRIFSYDGKPFLELRPVEMTQEDGEHGNSKIVATQHYRYLD